MNNILNTLTHQQFEELCFELIHASDFNNIQWRQGGADKGRDIQALKNSSNKIVGDFTETWFFECKRYTNGVPPEQLTSKITWADAEKPNHLVFFISSYLTTSCKDWIEKTKPTKPYKIHIIEGSDIIKILENNSKIYRKFFQSDYIIQLLEEAQRNWVMHNFLAEISVLGTILESKYPVEKFSTNDLIFILCSYYFNYDYLIKAKDYLWDFDDSMITEILDELKTREGYSKSIINPNDTLHVIAAEGFADDEVIAGQDFNAYLFQIEENHTFNIYVIKRIGNDALEFSIQKTTSLNAKHRLIKNYNLDYYKKMLDIFESKPSIIENIIRFNSNMFK